MRPIAKISGPTTIDATYAGYDVYATGGLYAITLDSTSIVPPDGSDIRIINGDALSGKRLVGFPAPFTYRPKLWPYQSLGVNSVDGNWFATQDPGRWMVPGQIKIFVSSLSGASDDNDGLSYNTPVRTLTKAVNICQMVMDIQQSAPCICPIAGSTFVNDPLSMGGQPTGGNLIQLSIWGTGQVSIESLDTPAITVGDNAELNIALNEFGPGSLLLYGNQADHYNVASGICMHNGGLFDASATDNTKLIIRGNGSNNSAIFFDGTSLGAAMGNGLTFIGVCKHVWNMNEGGARFTWSGGLKTGPIPQLANPQAVQGILGIYGNNEMIMGGPQNSFDPVSSWSYCPQSRVGGHGILVDGGLSIPGGAMVIPGSHGLIQATPEG